MKRHSEEKLSTEPEVGVVIAKTTMQHIRLILQKNQIRKTKRQKQALTVICTILPLTQTNYNIFQQSSTQWSPSINIKRLKKVETLGLIQSVSSFLGQIASTLSV